ncbi:transmembrane protein 254 isoform X3 [Peromyscus leucopus]|uniref:transmembrane protein 254 isoform X3 n=1 Tax=Peromyscus leucopus TaxID=10041 RepID=UPI001884D71D|nr:transmembrane protein 254 isoform X3 [Peromyscus leucopus]
MHRHGPRRRTACQNSAWETGSPGSPGVDQGGKRFLPYNSVFRALTMVVAKSEARRDTTVYFRTARPWPSLVTALGLGYFTILACVANSCGRVLICHGIMQA